jgi:hypothetical protein
MASDDHQSTTTTPCRPRVTRVFGICSFGRRAYRLVPATAPFQRTVVRQTEAARFPLCDDSAAHQKRRGLRSIFSGTRVPVWATTTCALAITTCVVHVGVAKDRDGEALGSLHKLAHFSNLGICSSVAPHHHTPWPRTAPLWCLAWFSTRRSITTARFGRELKTFSIFTPRIAAEDHLVIATRLADATSRCALDARHNPYRTTDTV